jgi:hypothetical protein
VRREWKIEGRSNNAASWDVAWSRPSRLGVEVEGEEEGGREG